MSQPDVDEVLNYLSTKFNKIFCEREFVCCVIEDFQVVLENASRTCVLVFPSLGPLYLKALRYQARIFDLAVFNITSASGRFKSVAVCRKDQFKMAEAPRRKRPERQLYVPPAQRAPRQRAEQKCSTAQVFTLSDVVHLGGYFHTACGFSKATRHHCSCPFYRLLLFKRVDSMVSFPWPIKIYDHVGNLWRISWKFDRISSMGAVGDHFRAYPLFDFDLPNNFTQKPTAVLVNNDLCDEDLVLCQELENYVYKIVCGNNSGDLDDSILDLNELDLGHFFMFFANDCQYLYECQQRHDVDQCRSSITKQFLEAPKAANGSATVIETIDKSEIAPKDSADLVKNQINTNKKKVSDSKHEQEKKIMRITKEHINRKTRPIMKYVDDSNDRLKIDDNDSVNNWEDLFDDDGQIQEVLLTEIVDKVGNDITIVKANEDYTAYTNKPPEDLEHVVELYNFPSSLETRDLVQAFSEINSDAMYIKWVDDTHALLVLGSLTQAQKAISMKNPLIKVRPMTAASSISMDVANKSDLKPAMKRPPTNLQTARRLITSHLGTKSRVTKEQMAKEKQDLKNAKEMKRMIKQSEKDAWEGNIRSLSDHL